MMDIMFQLHELFTLPGGALIGCTWVASVGATPKAGAITSSTSFGVKLKFVYAFATYAREGSDRATLSTRFTYIKVNNGFWLICGL